MRFRMRVSGLLAAVAIGAAALLAPAPAAAAPSMSLTSSFTTVTSLGTGAGLAEPSVATDMIGITGSEYEGHPPPLTHLTVGFPAGTVLSDTGFATCPKSKLEPSGPGPAGCPAGSVAGPQGSFSAWVAFDEGFELESGTVEPFFSPEGGLYLFFFGHDPELLEILATARYTAAQGSSGPAVDFEVPLVETVPGSSLASLVAVTLKLGAARQENGQPVGSVTTPGTCSGQMSWSVVGTFYGDPSPAEADAAASCPPPSAAELEAARKAGEEAAARKAAEEAAARKAVEEASKRLEAVFDAAKASLRSWLAPRSADAKIGRLLRHRGFTTQVSIPPGSVITVHWYSSPHGGRIGRSSTLLAAGRVAARSSGATRLSVALTKAGRRLLSRSRSLGITADGTLTLGPSTTKAVRVFRVSR